MAQLGSALNLIRLDNERCGVSRHSLGPFEYSRVRNLHDGASGRRTKGANKVDSLIDGR